MAVELLVTYTLYTHAPKLNNQMKMIGLTKHQQLCCFIKWNETYDYGQ